jgi:hypothetical protein
MFSYPLRVQLKTSKVEVEDDGPRVIRTCRMGLEAMLDSGIAQSVGGNFGVDALQALRDLTTTKVEFPIDAITARAELVGLPGTDPISLEEVTGIKAVASVKKPKADGASEPPMVKLEFDFPFSDGAWLFLGKNSGAWIQLTLYRAEKQLELPTATKPSADNPTIAGPGFSIPLLTPEKARELAAAGKESPPGPWRPRVVQGGAAQDERDVNQIADTPDEAEQMRADRLAEQTEETAPGAGEGLPF